MPGSTCVAPEIICPKPKVTGPIRTPSSWADWSRMPVARMRITVGTRRPPFSLIVVTVYGSVLKTVFVTFCVNARPPGPGKGEVVKMSGRVGTSTSSPRNTTPLLFTTKGCLVPATENARRGGTTNVISWRLTDFKPTAAPLIDIEIPLSSIGRVNRRFNEPTAVRAATGRSMPVVKFMIASIPGARPSEVGGVTGVGEGDGVGVGVGETVGVGDGVGVGLGVGVGVGVGVGDGVGVGVTLGATTIRLAPVNRLNETGVPVFTGGLSR